MSTFVTSGGNQSIFLEGGERVFPCWCGETHRGDYAQEDYNHHNCLHSSPLVQLPDINAPYIQAICMECGASFLIEKEPEGNMKRRENGKV